MKTTDELLQWGRDHKCYMELFPDGSVEVQFQGPYNIKRKGRRGEFDCRVEGATIWLAINNAKRYYARWLKGNEYDQRP